MKRVINLRLIVSNFASRGEKPLTHVLKVRNHGTVPAPGPHHWSPSADLYETRDEVVIDINLAGIQSAIVRIEMTPRVVKVSGHRAAQQEVEPVSFHLIEIERGNFGREFRLPAPIKPRDAQVNYEDGMLKIRLPKVSGGFFLACSAGSNEDFE